MLTLTKFSFRILYHYVISITLSYGYGCTGILLQKLTFWESFLYFVLYLLLCIFLSVMNNISNFVSDTSARISWRTRGERSDSQLYVAIMNHRKELTPQTDLSGSNVCSIGFCVNCRHICNKVWKVSLRAATKTIWTILNWLICRFLTLIGFSTFW